MEKFCKIYEISLPLLPHQNRDFGNLVSSLLHLSWLFWLNFPFKSLTNPELWRNFKKRTRSRFFNFLLFVVTYQLTAASLELSKKYPNGMQY